MVNTFPVRSCFEFCSTDKEAPQPCPRGGRRSRVWTFVACAAFGALFTLTSCETTLIDKLYAARNGDPEDMREAIVGIGEVLYSMEQNGVPYNKAALEAVEYLKEIVTSKADPLNRAQALAALASLTRPKVGELFVISLRDRFWLVRYEAARGISTNPSPEMTDPVIAQLHRETQSEVRGELVNAYLGARAHFLCGADQARAAVLADPGQRVCVSKESRPRVCALARRNLLPSAGKKRQGRHHRASMPHLGGGHRG